MLKWITFIRKTSHTDCRFCFKPSLYLFQERIQHERKHIASNTNREIGHNPLLHFFNVPKMIDQKNEQIMPQVHPQCIFANAAYNPCECIAILKLNGQRKHSQDKGHHKNRTVIKRRVIGCPRGYRNVVCQTKDSRP